MKKVLIALLAVIGLTISAHAQTSLQFGYGGYTQMDACDMHDGIGNVNTAWGGVTAAIYFQALPKLQLGASYTFSSSSFKHTDDCNIYYHVIMLNGKYDYYREGILKMYAHVGIGADISHMTFGDDSRNKGYFAFQVSPVCAEASISRSASLFGELGFGAQGLLQVGVRFKL